MPTVCWIWPEMPTRQVEVGLGLGAGEADDALLAPATRSRPGSWCSPRSAPSAAASCSPRARSSRLPKPRPTPTMRGAASRLTVSPSFGRRSTTVTPVLTSRAGDSTSPAPAWAPAVERLGHDGEHLDGRGQRLARHGGAAEGVAAGDELAVLDADAVHVGDAAGAELLRQARRQSPCRGASSPAGRRWRPPAGRSAPGRRPRRRPASPRGRRPRSRRPCRRRRRRARPPRRRRPRPAPRR